MSALQGNIFKPGTRQATKADLEWVLELLGLSNASFRGEKATVHDLRELIEREFQKLHSSLAILYGRTGVTRGDNLARLQAVLAAAPEKRSDFLRFGGQ